MENVRTGIIGIGHMGTAHANKIYSGSISGLTLTAVCDISKDRKSFALDNLTGVSFYDDWQELINSGECDAVIVATPHKLHAKISNFALERGLHVLTEKPQDIRVSQAQIANKAAKSSGKVYAIMFNQRTNPLFIRLREIIKNGELGELKSSNWIITNWYRSQYYYDEGDWRATWAGEGGGVLINQAVHNLDLWQWICGMPCEITAFCDRARYHSIEVEDAATIFARYENGATGTFITSTGECPGTNRLEVEGTLGKVVIENGTLKWWKLPEDERIICKTSDVSFPNVKTEYSEYTSDDSGKAHAGVLEAFAQAILNGSALIADGTEGINQLMLTNAAYLSQWLGNVPVKLPVDGEIYDRMLAERQKGSQVKETENKDIKGEYSNRWGTNW